MSSVVQFSLLLVLLLAVPGQDCATARVQRKARSRARSGCVKDGFSRCVDLAKLQQLIQDVQNGFSKIEEDMELLSKDAAILQLQRLKAASRKVVELSERATLDKAMGELPGLDDYIQGKGLRRS
ncbi:unnamed protein product [Coregonus sp. 'balchen']|nr:unnamed protein product [Coregonus sp. 'balchen']